MKKRFFLISISITTIAIILFGLISTDVYYESSIDYTKDILVVYMNQYDESIYSMDNDGAKEFSLKLDGARVTFMDKEGNVVGDSQVSDNLENHASRYEVQEAIKNGYGYDVRNSSSTYKKLIYYCVAFDNYLVRIAVPTSSLWAIFSNQIPTIIQFVIIDIICCALASWIVVDYILKPVEAISKNAALGKNVEATYPELVPIVNTINANNKTIQDKIDNIKENKRIESIVLDNMEHGIIILNENNDIVLMNNSASSILGVNKDINKLNYFENDDDIKNAILNKESGVFSRKIGIKDYDIRLTFTAGTEVFLITDVTEIKKAEKSKSDFIANVTHEMNTPLTSIKGFAELITHNQLDPDKINHAAEVILKQANRLSLLIKNIINYSSFESEDLPCYLVNVSEICNSVVTNLEGAIIEKGLVLNKNIEPNISINSRNERIIEIVTNLVTNAMKYNKPNGSIDVNLYKENDCAIFEVKDTGLGIAIENQQRIFDRFFTIDKSHNEHLSGFGLGLAIVKKICKIEGFTIDLKSELGVGTDFKIIMK
ncbi:MAG: ATP-binding protein [Anaeroplasmataceae bacterium]